jgi:PknH-like extracellular domain
MAVVVVASGCMHVVGGIASMPPTEGPYLDGMDVDELLLTTPELRDLTGVGLDLNAVPGMDSIKTVDDDLLVDSAPPECQFVFRESVIFGPDVKQFHKTSFQTPPKSELLSEGAAAYVDAATARRAFDNVAELVKGCGESSSGYAYVYDWSVDPQTVSAQSIGDCGRVYRLEATVLIEVTYCGYSHVIPDLIAARIAARVHAR